MLLTIAGVVSVLAIVNAMLPAVGRGNSAVVSVSGEGGRPHQESDKNRARHRRAG